MHAKSLVPSLTMLAGLTVCALGETHTVHFIDNCGFGTPTLVQGGNILSTGADFITNGPLLNAVAYLQTGSCGINGENCTTVDISLANPNPSDPGSGSSAAIDLVPPHAFSVVTGFGYYNGCDGAGQDCTNANCIAEIPGIPPPKIIVPVMCQADNGNIVITFCD